MQSRTLLGPPFQSYAATINALFIFNGSLSISCQFNPIANILDPMNPVLKFSYLRKLLYELEKSDTRLYFHDDMIINKVFLRSIFWKEEMK